MHYMLILYVVCLFDFTENFLQKRLTRVYAIVFNSARTFVDNRILYIHTHRIQLSFNYNICISVEEKKQNSIVLTKKK